MDISRGAVGFSYNRDTTKLEIKISHRTIAELDTNGIERKKVMEFVQLHHDRFINAAIKVMEEGTPYPNPFAKYKR